MDPSLFAFHKLAGAAAPSIPHNEKLDTHFTSVENTKWRDFRRNLRAKSFAAAVQQDERADERLKRFADMVGRHYASKDPGIPVQGSKRKPYMVKYHEDLDRFSCPCDDWVYTKSHKAQKDADCKHIQQVKASFHKQADISPVLKATAVLRKIPKHHEEELKARMVNMAYEQNMPKKKPLFG